jgi:hypothetical protein
MKCFNCNSTATLIPRIKHRKLEVTDLCDAKVEIALRNLRRITDTHIQQHAMTKCCDHYADLACCQRCIPEAAKALQEMGVQDDVMFIQISPVLLQTLEVK